MKNPTRTPSLKARLAAGDVILGTFVKTPSPIVVEVLGLTGLDCLCLDAEHAPFDRGTLDACLLAARACGMDALVRVPAAAPEHILNALDCGATGILVPHVRSADEARASVRASHYGAGGAGAMQARLAPPPTRRHPCRNTWLRAPHVRLWWRKSKTLKRWRTWTRLPQFREWTRCLLAV